MSGTKGRHDVIKTRKTWRYTQEWSLYGSNCYRIFTQQGRCVRLMIMKCMCSLNFANNSYQNAREVIEIVLTNRQVSEWLRTSIERLVPDLLNRIKVRSNGTSSLEVYLYILD